MMALNTILTNVIALDEMAKTYSQLDQAMQDPNSTQAQITEILNADAAISDRIMRIVNSSHFICPAPIESVSHAVTVIGTSQMRDLVLVLSLIRLSHTLNLPEQFKLTHFWQRNLTCGLIAKVIATFRREFNLESYFLAGVIHDIGQLFMAHADPEGYYRCHQQAQSAQHTLYQAEATQFGFHHGDVGASILHKWQLPEHLQEIAKHHHQPHNATEFQPLVSLICLAGNIACDMGYAEKYEQYSDEIDPKYLQQWGISADTEDAIQHQTQMLLTETIAAFLS